MPDKNTAASGQRRRLGRGLKSLLTDPVQVSVPPKDADAPSAGGREQNPNIESAGIVGDPAATTPASGVAESAAAAQGGVRPSAVTPPMPPSVPAPQADPAFTPAGEGTTGHTLRLIPIDRLQPNPGQPRRHFDEEALVTLGESIRSAGMMQPIVARPLPNAPGRYEIVAGERRYRAAGRIGLAEVPVIVHEIDDRTAAEFALIENLQREDLNPIERASAFRRLADEYGMTHEAIASAVGLDRASVSNHLRLLGLDDATLEDLRQGTLGMGHGRALLGVGQLAARRSLAEQAIRDGWSVRELEKRIRNFNRSEGDAATPPEVGPDPARSHLNDLERRLGDHLGTRVQVRAGRRAGTGEVRIRFFSHEDFEGLLERVGFRIDG